MLTVADILGTGQLELTLAGGGRGGGRPVRWAHISELDDPTPWLRGGELLLTTGTPLHGDSAGFVRRLHTSGLAGLGLGLGFGFEAMPGPVVEVADELGFPVFTIPYHVPFIAITETVFRRLADARLQTLEQLTGLLLEDRGLDSMLAEMGRVAGSELCLRDAAGRLLAGTSDLRSDGDDVLVLPVVTGSRVEAELLARSGRRCDQQLLHHLQTVLAVELLKRRTAADTERRLAGDLVEAILSGEISSRELRRRVRAFGLSGERPLAFAVLRPAADDAAALAALADAAGAAGPARVGDGAVAVLIEADDDQQAEAEAMRLLRQTDAGAAGVGRVRSDPAQLPRCYDEALYAVDARPANGHPAVATFRDLGSVQLLLSLQGERGVELFCDSLLGALAEHDRAHGSSLIESLTAYIEANGRWGDAAAALKVHRHTLRYRMRKIEELTGRDLDDAGDRLELWLALRAHALRTSPRPDLQVAP
ncbi:MAG: PucR family transcriptional regulator [Gaiellales bacterium]